MSSEVLSVLNYENLVPRDGCGLPVVTGAGGAGRDTRRGIQLRPT